jgi:uncharacterized protein YjiS (DUF1127 family)
MADMTTMRVGGIMDAVRAYSTYRRTIRELDHLSDRDLSDLGIARGDVRSAARYGTYGR